MRNFQSHRLTSHRQTPLKTRKPRIIVIKRNPFTPGLNSQCGKPCVRHQVTASVRFRAKAFENVPVLLARLNDHAVRLYQEYIAESEDFMQPAWHRKNFRVGRDADHTAQDLRSHTVPRIAVDHAVKPAPAALMIRGIRSEGMNENVDVWEYHGAFMTSSRSPERFRSTPEGRRRWLLIPVTRSVCDGLPSPLKGSAPSLLRPAMSRCVPHLPRVF